MDVKKDVTLFAQTNFRNENRKFGIKLDDRRRHMYVIGKTGMGKTTMLENMVLSDIYAGHGLCYVDPHGDTIEKILDFIPPHRINDVVYVNPSDLDFPIGFNILETVSQEHKHLVAAGLMGVFKKIWVDQWSARMEYLLNNAILALMDYPGSTLLGVNRIFADAAYRKKIVEQVKDPVVKAFWVDEFAKYTDKFASEATAAIQNKIGQFLSASVIRNIVAQVKSTINIREIMDSRKILLVNLSKGRIGEDNSRLLGGMIVTKIQLSAMERVEIPEDDRKDFFLYVDEFQNFATESFANILSEARKYRLSLIMAHQYIEQLAEEVAAAVFGNVGTLITFRVGAPDAEVLEKEFDPYFLMADLVNLPKFQIYLRLMIDGVASTPFSATTLPPIAVRTGSTAKVIAVSRERYGRPREVIEQKIAKWSGVMGFLESEEEQKPVRRDPAWGASAAPAGPAPIVVLPDNRPPRPELKKIVVLPEAPAAPAPSKDQKDQRDNQVSGGLTGGQTGVNQGEPGKKRKRKRNKNKGEGGGEGQQHQPQNHPAPETLKSAEKHASPVTPSDFKQAPDVLIGDPNQKGMSLDDLKP